MNLMLPQAAVRAAVPVPAPEDTATSILQAAEQIGVCLEKGVPVPSSILREAMEAAFGGSDAEGLWTWKTAYEVSEAAQILFLRKYGQAMEARAATPAALLAMMVRIAGLLPTHTRRSQESETLQQFSTPLPLALIARLAAGITSDDVVLEPSAGTGMLAVFAGMTRARLALNEIADVRAFLLKRLFPDAVVTAHDAANIHDRLDPHVNPSVVLMNPPFSATLHVAQRRMDTTFKHIASAFARLAQGGRLVTITGASVSPDNPAWRESFVELQQKGGTVRFSCAIDGAIYAKHGTTFYTRLTVIDKLPVADATFLPPSMALAATASDLLEHLIAHVPSRAVVSGAIGLGEKAKPGSLVRSFSPIVRKPEVALVSTVRTMPTAASTVELAYEAIAEADMSTKADLTDALYEGYILRSIRISEPRFSDTIVRTLYGRGRQCLRLQAVSWGARQRLCRRGKDAGARRHISFRSATFV